MNDINLARDEFIGLNVKIVESKDPSLTDITGVIIDETKNTFLIENENKQIMIGKKGVKLEFKIDGKKILIDGSKIIFRPENRIKKIR